MIASKSYPNVKRVKEEHLVKFTRVKVLLNAHEKSINEDDQKFNFQFIYLRENNVNLNNIVILNGKSNLCIMF